MPPSIAFVAVLLRLVPDGILAAEYHITVTPARFPSGADIDIAMSVTALRQQPQSYSLVLKQGSTETTLFTAKSHSCSIFRSDITLQCDFAKARFNMQILKYVWGESKVYMIADGTDPGRSELVKLDYFVAPAGVAITVNPTNVVVDSTVRLEAQFIGGKNNLADYSWQGPFRSFRSRGSYSVMSFRALSRDMGKYYCVAEYVSQLGQVFTDDVYLNVQYPPHLAKKYHESAIGMGGNVNLIANFSSNPEPSQVYWEKEGVRIDTCTSRCRTQCELELRNVTCSDYGKYTCVVVNALGRDEAIFHLRRNAGAEFRLSEMGYLKLREEIRQLEQAVEAFRGATITFGLLLGLSGIVLAVLGHRHQRITSSSPRNSGAAEPRGVRSFEMIGTCRLPYRQP